MRKERITNDNATQPNQADIGDFLRLIRSANPARNPEEINQGVNEQPADTNSTTTDEEHVPPPPPPAPSRRF